MKKAKSSRDFFPASVVTARGRKLFGIRTALFASQQDLLNQDTARKIARDVLGEDFFYRKRLRKKIGGKLSTGDRGHRFSAL